MYVYVWVCMSILQIECVSRYLTRLLQDDLVKAQQEIAQHKERVASLETQVGELEHHNKTLSQTISSHMQPSVGESAADITTRVESQFKEMIEVCLAAFALTHIWYCM